MTDEVLLNLCRQAKTILKNGRALLALLFSGASNLCRYIFSVAQPVDAGKTVTSGTDESVAASIRHHKNVEGDLFAGGCDGALKGVLKSAAAGHLHAREGDGLDIVCGKDLAELFGIIDGVELRAADERHAAFHEIGVEAAAGIGAAIGGDEQIRTVKIRGLDRRETDLHGPVAKL